MPAAETTGGAPKHRFVLWCLVGELAIAAIVYSRTLGNGFVLDDYAQIVNNRRIGEWSFFWRSLVNNARWFSNPRHPPAIGYYRPLQNVWFAANFHLFGLNPAGWHAAAIALQLAAVWLAYRVSAVLTGSQWTGVAAAGLFAVLPLHAEPVACIFTAGTTLGAAFELAAFAFYLTPSHPPRLIGPLAMFVCALLSYDSAIMFPALIAAHAFIFPSPAHFAGEGGPKRGGSGAGAGAKIDSPMNCRAGDGAASAIPRRARDAIAAAWPYLLVAIAYLAIRIWVLGFISRPNPFNRLTQTQVILTAPRTIMTYLGLLLMPWRAGPTHPLAFVSSAAPAGFWLPLGGLIAFSAAAWFVLRNHPHRRLYLFCALWFGITLFPILRLDLLFVKYAIQDRYLYLPSFAICVIAADLGVGLARRNQQARNAIIAGAGAIAIGYAAILFTAEHYWHDDAAVYARCAELDPGSDLWRTGLAAALLGRGDFAGARRALAAEVRLFPDAGENVYYELALADEKLGDRRAAVAALAERLKRLNPPTAEAYADLAIAHGGVGDWAAADAALNKAAALAGGAEIAARTRKQLRRLRGRSNPAPKSK
ncbi:MAG: tetratricopeptide repeat protein [Candidatus Binataceae bacterium]